MRGYVAPVNICWHFALPDLQFKSRHSNRFQRHTKQAKPVDQYQVSISDSVDGVCKLVSCPELGSL